MTAVGRLAGKRCLVAGGNGGIGLGIARAFRKEGAGGMIVGRNEKTLAEAASSLGGAFAAHKADVTDLRQLDGAARSLASASGGIDVVVCCAGGPTGPESLGPVERLSEAAFDAMIALNLKSALFLVQKTLAHMPRGGSVVMIGSLAAHRGYPGAALYACAKAGLLALTRTLAVELAPRAIRVNALTPGVVDTAVFERAGASAEEARAIKIGFAERTPLRRMGTPAEIGAAAVFLASEESSFITGAEILADGGLSVG